ncbi:CobW family GTP-binding protein [Allokutzneria albata]|uniref:GTPase, G3E family n=1 Tax=Allokutzneria albata TaxID=211114 RepID=A0A1G9RRU5_ALLAB|nr:GTP-binding protein [Allokutzneria albata]SDM25884.1 GTPase, G3E family [Allokutzneria albata]
MGRKQIPVVIVAGFLGSGKTTLLNHLLSASGGTRIGVVVNDFGSINIDAMQVAGQVDSMISLGNGCLCCLVDASGMDALLERLARPGAGIDVIVIEASGLAEPRDLIRMVLASDNPRLCYGGLVEVVDGAEFESSRRRHPELDKHLRYADLVVLNKIDRIDAEQQRLLHKTVTELSEGRPVLPASHGRVDPALLFEQRPKRDEVARQLSFDDLDDDHSAHAHAAYQSVEFSSAKPLNPRRLMAFLDSRPAGLYRMKGFVHFGLPGHRQKHVLHTVGGFLRFERSRWEQGEAHHTHLVLIGAGIDADAVRAGLAECVETDPAPSDTQAMLLIAPYLR